MTGFDDTLGALRRLLLGIATLGLIGIGVELLLLGHFEDWWQLVPLVLVAGSLLSIAWHVVEKGRASLRAVRWMMGLCVASGILGMFLHYRGNTEFELEMMPGIEGMELFRNAITGATPALAPGAMIQLGLIGLAYAFRHPAWHAGRVTRSNF